MLRCVINYFILVQLGSHLSWSGSTLTFLWLLWVMKKNIGGKEKENLKNGMWIGKQLQCSRRHGCFVIQWAYSLLNVTSFQTLNSHHPHSVQLWQRSCQDKGETDCQTYSQYPDFRQMVLRGSHLEVSWELPVHSCESCVMATPVFVPWRKYWDLFSCIHHKPRLIS